MRLYWRKIETEKVRNIQKRRSDRDLFLLINMFQPLGNRVSPKAPLVMLKLLPSIFLFHLVQTFRFFWLKKISIFFSTPINFLTVRDPPCGGICLKYFRMVFLIAQIKRFGTLNATQKNRIPLQSTVLEKIRKKLPKNFPKN